MLHRRKLTFVFLSFSLVFVQNMVRASQGIDTIMNKITEALNVLIHDAFSLQEREYLNRIASLRKQLATDTLKIKNATVSYMEARFSMPHDPWGRFLFSLIRKLQPNSFVELGTCIGLSGAYITAGLEANNKGKMITIENFMPLVPVANRTFKQLNFTRFSVFGGEVDEQLSKVFNEFSSLDIVFDDHIHAQEPVIRNFNTIYPFLSDVAVYLFDDIDHNEEMRHAWETIKNDKRVNVTISLALGVPYAHPNDFDGIVRPRIGIAIIDKKSNKKKNSALKISSLKACKGVFYKNSSIYTLN